LTVGARCIRLNDENKHMGVTTSCTTDSSP